MGVLDLSKSQLHGIGVGDQAVDVQLSTQAAGQRVARPNVVQLKREQQSFWDAHQNNLFGLISDPGDLC